MKSIAVMKFGASSAQVLVQLISSNQVFQQANHSGDLVYLAVQDCDTQGAPIYDERGNLTLVSTNIGYDDLTSQLRAQKWKTFVIMDTVKDSFAHPLARPKVELRVFVEELGTPGNSKIFYFGENYSNIRDPVLYSVTKPCVVVTAYVAEIQKECEVIFPFDTPEEANKFSETLWKEAEKTKLYVSGMHIKLKGWKLAGGVSQRVEKWVFVVSWHAHRVDHFTDVAKMIPKINSFEDLVLFRNVENGVPLYPREVNELLWFNVAYVKLGDPVFNLILSGAAGSGKTTCMKLYAEIFGDNGSIIGAGGTQKGLVPSFSGDEPKPGALASASFFVCVDEFFQMPGDVARDIGLKKESLAYEQYLRRLLPVITRQENIHASAKNTEFKVQMKAAFMGTDNLKEHTRLALQTLISDDLAVLRRFVLVYIGKETWREMKMCMPANAEDNMDFLKKMWMEKYGYELSELKRFAEWFRSVSKNVRVEGRRCLKTIEESFSDSFAKSMSSEGRIINQDIQDAVIDVAHKIDYVPCMTGLVRCCATMRSVYELNDEKLPVVVVKDEDYDSAKRIFERIVTDSSFLFKVALAQKAGAGGILRSV